MKLKKIGFFKELPFGDDPEASLIASVGKIDTTNLLNVVSYLKSGHSLVVAPGISRDILSSDRNIIGSIAILTDGVYAWPRDTAYYVERYKASLPEEFLDHMKGRSWRIPPFDESDLEL